MASSSMNLDRLPEGVRREQDVEASESCAVNPWDGLPRDSDAACCVI